MTRMAKGAAAALLLMIGVGGCGKEVVVGGQKHVDTGATGDGTPEGSASGARAPAFALSPAGGISAATARAQGTISFDAKVSVVTSGGAVVPLSGSPATATVRIDGSDTVHVVSGDVPAGTYTAARVTFTRVQANVTGGLILGGVGATGLFTVSILPGDSIVVQRAVNLGAPEADVRLLVDLDASAWLGTANPATRLIAAAAFRDAVKLRTY
ncbi:MAG TPA: hypothetical protein VF771_01645 [Longimicrobiaceae bacterium]